MVYVVRSGRSWSVGQRRGGRTACQGRRRHDASCSSVFVVVDVTDSAVDVVTSPAPARPLRTPPRPRPQAAVHRRRRRPGHYRHHRHRPACHASVVQGQSDISTKKINCVEPLGTSLMLTTFKKNSHVVNPVYLIRVILTPAVRNKNKDIRPSAVV